jgi:hypothetical protein
MSATATTTTRALQQFTLVQGNQRRGMRIDFVFTEDKWASRYPDKDLCEINSYRDGSLVKIQVVYRDTARLIWTRLVKQGYSRF